MNKETKEFVEGLIQKHTQCDISGVEDWVGVLREDPSRAFDIVDELCEALDIGDTGHGLKITWEGVDLSSGMADTSFKGGFITMTEAGDFKNEVLGLTELSAG